MKKKVIASILSVLLATQIVTVSASNQEIVDMSMASASQEEVVTSELDNFKLSVKDFHYLLKDSKEKFADLDLEESIECLKKEKKQSDKRFTKIQDDSEMDYLNWGQKMLHVDDKNVTVTTPERKVKVAIIDSGVNYCEDIDVAVRKNFILDDEDVSPLYEDASGHGTNIAGIIAAKDNEEGITGINPNVELYSARVLDGSNNAPISRVIEAIEWAIECDVDIINLSFTTDVNSAELLEVIQKAYDKGILIIAAAGNSEDGNSGVKYPAAYPEVIAVGSVNSEGEASSFSPSGSQIELVAPGELVTSTDIFDTLSTHSGTSYAAPYVTAIASKLWEQDVDCSRDFIRAVLDISANLYGEQQSYGYGLVDYEYANKVFQALKPLATENHNYNAIVDYAVNVRNVSNTSSVPVMNATDEMVEGAWSQDNHEAGLGGFTLASENDKKLLISGCRLPDSPVTKLNGMTLNPYFHGYCYYTVNGVALEDSNYIAGGIYLTKIAKKMLSGEVYNTSSGYLDRQYHQISNIIDNTYINKRDGVTWSAVDSKIQYYTGATFDPNNAHHRAMVIYGMALHSFADIFAHSAIYNGDLIKHVTIGGYENAADNTSFIPQRFWAASLVCQKALGQISNYTSCDISIFDLSGTGYENYVKLLYFNYYADIVCNRSSLFSYNNYYSYYFSLLDAGI